MSKQRFVVVTDAVTVTTARKANGRPEYQRIMRGGVINGTSTSEQIQRLLSKGGIVPVGSDQELAELQADLAQGRRSANRMTLRKIVNKEGVNKALLQALPEPIPAPLPEDALANQPGPEVVMATDLPAEV